MNFNDDKSISLMSTTAMHSKTFVGSVEMESWKSNNSTMNRKERILEVRKQESMINRSQITNFQDKVSEQNEDELREKKYKEYLDKKKLIEEQLEEKKRIEEQTQANIIRNKKENEGFQRKQQENIERKSRQAVEASDRGKKALEKNLEVLQVIRKADMEREEIRTNVNNLENERSQKLVDEFNRNQKILQEKQKNMEETEKNVNFPDTLNGNRVKYFGSKNFEKTSFHNTYIVQKEEEEGINAYELAKNQQEEENSRKCNFDKEVLGARCYKAEQRGRDALRKISADKSRRRLEDSAEKIKKEERNQRLVVLSNKRNTDRTDALEGKRKKRQKDLESIFLEMFIITDKNELAPRDENLKKFDERRVAQKIEKNESKGFWEVPKDKWYEHNKTKNLNKKRIFLWDYEKRQFNSQDVQNLAALENRALIERSEFDTTQRNYNTQDNTIYEKLENTGFLSENPSVKKLNNSKDKIQNEDHRQEPNEMEEITFEYSEGSENRDQSDDQDDSDEESQELGYNGMYNVEFNNKGNAIRIKDELNARRLGVEGHIRRHSEDGEPNLYKNKGPQPQESPNSHKYQEYIQVEENYDSYSNDDQVNVPKIQHTSSDTQEYSYSNDGDDHQAQPVGENTYISSDLNNMNTSDEELIIQRIGHQENEISKSNRHNKKTLESKTRNKSKSPPINEANIKKEKNKKRHQENTKKPINDNFINDQELDDYITQQENYLKQIEDQRKKSLSRLEQNEEEVFGMRMDVQELDKYNQYKKENEEFSVGNSNKRYVPPNSYTQDHRSNNEEESSYKQKEKNPDFYETFGQNQNDQSTNQEIEIKETKINENKAGQKLSSKYKNMPTGDDELEEYNRGSGGNMRFSQDSDEEILPGKNDRKGLRLKNQKDSPEKDNGSQNNLIAKDEKEYMNKFLGLNGSAKYEWNDEEDTQEKDNMEHEATIGNYDLTYSPSNPQDTQNSAEKNAQWELSNFKKDSDFKNLVSSKDSKMSNSKGFTNEKQREIEKPRVRVESGSPKPHTNSLADAFKKRQKNSKIEEKVLENGEESNDMGYEPKKRSKEEMLELRKKRMAYNPQNVSRDKKAASKDPKEKGPLLDENGKKLPIELMDRLAKGGKVKVNKKDMKSQTEKNYAKLPEIQKKKEEQQKKDDLKQRMLKVKELDKALRKK